MYEAKKTLMDGLIIKVIPDKLSFKKKHETQSYTLSKQGPRMMKNKIIVHGSITWVELTGRHYVRSPIVATHLNSQILAGKY